jgi:type IV pilus assembly protein PilQ
MKLTKHAVGALAMVASLSQGISVSAWAASVISAIDFKGTQEPAQLLIRANGPITFEKSENARDSQIVLNIHGAKLSKPASRKIDTSSFNGNVALISPYEVKGEPDTVRVVVQLRKPGGGEVVQEGNVLKLSMGVGSSSPESSSAQSVDSAPGAESASVSAAATASAAASVSDSPNLPPVILDAATATSSAPATNLEAFMAGKQSNNFNGRRVSMHFRDVDAAAVFELISEASGFNIIVGDDVKGKITISMDDVPWDQALDVVLHTLRLGVERNNNILRIVTLANLAAEKTEELTAKRAAEAAAPRMTRIFPISYANLTDLQATLTKFASAGTESKGAVADTAVVQVDKRTNSIVVRDLPDNIERMKKLIESLDTQTPQVMIEAKIVEASEGFTKVIGGSLGVGGTGTTQFATTFMNGNPIDRLLGSPGVFADGGAAAATSNSSGTFAVSPSMSFLPGVSRLNALLNLGESENMVKVVSSPKTVVLNKEKASIVSGTPVLVPGVTTVAGVGSIPTASVVNANLSLEATPTITNDGGVMMELKVTRDVPSTLVGGSTSQSAISNRNMQTIVLVESGSTLVIGGIYTSTTRSGSSGFPILRKIPILGALFGSETDQTDRSELFIFITPRILNTREAGLSG